MQVYAYGNTQGYAQESTQENIQESTKKIDAQENETRFFLMPYPRQLDVKSGTFLLPKKIVLKLDAEPSQRMEEALARFIKKLQLQTDASSPYSIKKTDNVRRANIHISIRKSADLNENSIGIDEAYQLSISKSRITINADSEIGALRALETFLQLVGHQKNKVIVPQLTISDFPRFKWRGLLLDTSRHFFSVDTIKRQLDGMAAAKLNIFHWHLTDDQGWRLESIKFPKLTLLGADGEFYSHSDVRDIVDYAKQRGIHVLPEIDMPGHASALALAYPELMSAPGPFVKETEWGVHKPTMNVADEKVYEFVDGLISEVVELFPFEYIHIGGDEVEPTQWNSNSAIQEFMRQKELKKPHDLQAYFNNRVAKILEKHKRKMVGWDEIQHPDLPKNIVVQSWRGPDAVSDAVSHGFQAVLSTGYYLDQAQPASYHYRVDPVPIAPYAHDRGQ